jgi:hypothetical protein
MIGFTIEISLVTGLFLVLWRRQVRERQRLRERAAQMDFDFLRDRGK